MSAGLGPRWRQGRFPVKASAGIVVCRRNAASGRPEALLVRKRYTYAFSEFIHGRFAFGAGVPPSRGVAALLDAMTTEELLDVWSLNFAQMWFRVWLAAPNRELFEKKRDAFEERFLRADAGAGLRRLVGRARANGACLWEPPKGRPLSPREADIFCAVREVREEAGLDTKDYRLLPGARITSSHLGSGVRYVRTFFVALANPHFAAQASAPGGRAALRPVPHMAEVGEVRWLDIELVRLVDGPERRLERVVGPAFRLVKKYLRGRWACRRAGRWDPPRAGEAEAAGGAGGAGGAGAAGAREGEAGGAGAAGAREGEAERDWTVARRRRGSASQNWRC